MPSPDPAQETLRDTPLVRPAHRRDIPAILRLVRELAAYEKEPEAVVATERMYADALFPDRGGPRVYAHVAEVNGAVVAMAVWFVNFSTWTGRHGIWLEDLYVEEAHRCDGLGVALLAALARLCIERGWTRIDWSVLRWNTPAIEIYEALSAAPQTEWLDYRLQGEALAALARR